MGAGDADPGRARHRAGAPFSLRPPSAPCPFLRRPGPPRRMRRGGEAARRGGGGGVGLPAAAAADLPYRLVGGASRAAAQEHAGRDHARAADACPAERGLDEELRAGVGGCKAWASCGGSYRSSTSSAVGRPVLAAPQTIVDIIDEFEERCHRFGCCHFDDGKHMKPEAGLQHANCLIVITPYRRVKYTYLPFALRCNNYEGLQVFLVLALITGKLISIDLSV